MGLRLRGADTPPVTAGTKTQEWCCGPARNRHKAKPGRTPYLAACFFAWLALIADLSGS